MTCPECGEFKRVTLRVGPTSEKAPKPVYKYACKVCGTEWSVDENRPTLSPSHAGPAS
jgi:transposase-like protein